METETLPSVKRLKREEIEQKAAQILRAHGLYSVPIDPVALANRNGIRVLNAAFSEEGLSGLVAKRGSDIQILVNQNDTSFRKRFTIAHEMGHFFLHLTNQDGEFIDKNADLYREEEPQNNLSEERIREMQANQFAAGLLMPGELVRNTYKTGLQDLTRLAELFNVSEPAMGFRLNRLNLI